VRATRRTPRLVLALVFLFLAGGAGGDAWAQGGWPPKDAVALLKLRGFALNLTGVGVGRSGDVEIGIERWSSDEERDRLKGALAQSGAAGLSEVLLAVAPRVGYVAARRGRTSELKYARQTVLPDGGRRIVLATEGADIPADGSNPRADTHDFLVVEVRLDKDGKGEGRSAGAERLRYNAKTAALELDRYGTEPVWIRNLAVAPE